MHIYICSMCHITTDNLHRLEFAITVNKMADHTNLMQTDAQLPLQFSIFNPEQKVPTGILQMR